jgi:UDPglucose 6-dehydrogenase
MPRTFTKRQGDADAVLILTDWKEFAEIDLARLNRAVRFPIVIDGRNLYKPQEMLDHGFTYVSVGRPASYQAQQGKPRKPGVWCRREEQLL